MGANAQREQLVAECVAIAAVLGGNNIAAVLQRQHHAKQLAHRAAQLAGNLGGGHGGAATGK